jgi:hypothetical protein
LRLRSDARTSKVNPAGRKLEKLHGDRVGLLAGGAAGAPDANGSFGGATLALDDLREYVFLEGLPVRGVAEEAGEVGRDRVEKYLQLVLIVPDVFIVSSD